MAFMNDFGVVMRLGPSAGLSPEEMMHRCSESSQRWPFSLRVGWEGRPFPPNAVGTHPPTPPPAWKSTMRIRKRSHSPLEKVCAVRVEPCIQFLFICGAISFVHIQFCDVVFF